MLSQYLNGKATPRLPNLVALAEYFKVSLDYLVFGRQASGSTVVEEHLGEVRPDKVARTVTSVERVWRAVEAGGFYPAPSMVGCASCGYRQACAEWRG